MERMSLGPRTNRSLTITPPLLNVPVFDEIVDNGNGQDGTS